MDGESGNIGPISAFAGLDGKGLYFFLSIEEDYRNYCFEVLCLSLPFFLAMRAALVRAFRGVCGLVLLGFQLLQLQI